MGARLDEAGFDLADEPACFDVLTASSWRCVCGGRPSCGSGERRETTTEAVGLGRTRPGSEPYDLDAVEQTRRGKKDAANAPVEGRPIQAMLEDDLASR